VSIINYRTAEMTIRCAESALADIEGSGTDGHVVIVENGSEDGSEAVLAEWVAARPADGAPVTLVVSETNSGFSGGHNRGIGAVAAEHYLILNSDALLSPGFCAAILAVAEADPRGGRGGGRIGIVAPRIAYEDGTPQTSAFRFASPASELIRAANTGWVTRALKRREVALGPDPDPSQIEWASGACLLLRGAMVGEIGPMDEGYFLYFEDAEYCLRARRAGWGIAWAPEAVAVHLRGGSGPVKALARARRRMPAYFYASRTRFLYQAHGRAGVWAANAAWYAGTALAKLRGLIGRPTRPPVEREARDIWINARRPLGPRRAPWEERGEESGGRAS
jgi:GT2 family glycosyltransferase